MKSLLLSTLVMMTSLNVAVANKPMKVLSWNIYMLPGVAPCPRRGERAELIGELLKVTDVDIVVFQEAFFKKSRTAILEAVGDVFPFSYGPANNIPGIRTNSGLWVLSKIPLNEISEIVYEKCASWDCLARKGAMLLEGVWEGKPFQLVNTHLQADGYDEIRDFQLCKLGSEIQRIKRDGVIQIICGDFNSVDTSWVEKCTKGALIELDGCIADTYDGINNPMAKKFGATTQFTIDHILVSEPVQSCRKVFSFGAPWLSDHYGVICQIW